MSDPPLKDSTSEFTLVLEYDSSELTKDLPDFSSVMLLSSTSLFSESSLSLMTPCLFRSSSNLSISDNLSRMPSGSKFVAPPLLSEATVSKRASARLWFWVDQIIRFIRLTHKIFFLLFTAFLHWHILKRYLYSNLSLKSGSHPCRL